jgi:hypothetical protein
LERAGITLYRSLPCDWLHVPSIRNLTCSLGLDRTGRYPSPQPFLQIHPSCKSGSMTSADFLHTMAHAMVPLFGSTSRGLYDVGLGCLR